MAKSKLLKPRGGLAVRAVGDETLVVDRVNGQVHQLNPTASYIWSKLDGKEPLARIVEMLCERFDVDASVAARDVAALAEDLKQRGLLSSQAEG